MSFLSFISLKNDVNVPSKIKKLKNLLDSLMKRAETGAGARSVSQRYRSSDPVPYQNVTDPEHWSKQVCTSRDAGGFKRV
jgi:hypothetical protein